MFASKVSISEETLEKNRISTKQKGRMRYSKLEESAKNGNLAKATNRFEVANLVGYPEHERRKGYSWVSNLISKHYLSEVISHYDERTRQPVYSYYLGEETPAYGKTRKARVKKPAQTTRDTIEKVVEEKAKIEPVTQELSITTDKINIKVRMSEDKLVELIKEIMKGD